MSNRTTTTIVLNNVTTEYIIKLDSSQRSTKELMIYNGSNFDGVVLKLGRRMKSLMEDGVTPLAFTDVVAAGTETPQEWTVSGAGYLISELYRSGELKLYLSGAPTASTDVIIGLSY